MSAPLFILLAVCLAVSFFLSGMEAGVFALSRFRIRRLIREGNPQARLLYQYLERPEDFLWTIFTGNTLANFVATALTVLAVHDWLRLQPERFWLVFIPGGLLFYAAFDLLPKMLFRLYPNRLCLMFLGPFRLVHQLLRPAIWLLARSSDLLLGWAGRQALSGRLFGTRDELRQLMQESASKMTTEERSMINRVLDLQTLTVSRIMVPLARVPEVKTSSPVGEVLTLCREQGLTRLPVWEPLAGGRRRVAGFLNVRSMLYEPELDAGKTAGEYLKPALFLDEDRRVEDAMRQLQRSGQRIAIVLDRERREVGMVSLQDILKVVFGEFRF
jgi:putative hemolysin